MLYKCFAYSRVHYPAPAMFVSLLVVILGSTALAAPLEDDHADNDDLGLDDMILSDVQKEMFSKSLIETPEQQAEADNYNEDQPLDQGGDVATGASAIGIERFKWPGKKLYYSLSALWFWKWSLKSKVRAALKDLEKKIDGCVKFIEKDDGPRVEVHSHDGCQSEVGFQNKVQELNLGSGCTRQGKIQHEFLHALGFFHMQNRSDRDEYITVNKDNIKSGAQINFTKHQPWLIKHFGLPFDYSSIMMYGGYFMSRNGKKTIVTKDPSKQNLLGNRSYLTDGDIAMIKKAYGCA